VAHEGGGSGMACNERKCLRSEFVGFSVEVSQEIEGVIESCEDGSEILGGSEQSRGELSINKFCVCF
jgi:hypothetical protein